MPPFLRRLAAVSLVVAVAVPAGVADAAPCWRPPVDAPVTDPFREPVCTWCPGNRGIEYGTARGTSVRSVGAGTISWAGTVAGTVYVVVRHPDGRRVTYADLTEERFDTGDRVRRGQTIGRTAGRLHFGVREGGRYVDPARFLGRTAYPARLIPMDGRRANPSPPPRIVCAR